MVTEKPSSLSSRHTDVAIVGAGFAGLGMAIRLKQTGASNFTVFERAAEIGGTWRDNSYPGCACDVESQLYSYSFAANPNWSRMFSPQPEIQAYLLDCAARFGIRPNILFGHEVKGIHWEAARHRWRVVTSQGEWTAGVVISAMGPLSEPKVPTLPGMASFEGKVFHSARWDHQFDLKQKRVAVIGTGASAIQFVPAIQPDVQQLYLFQRTPAWVVPRLDRPFTEKEQRWFRRVPLVQSSRRLFFFCLREFYGFTFRHPRFLKTTQDIASRHMKRAVKSPALRGKLTPSYKIGCKRILISNDFFPAVAKANVEVVTEGIREITPRGVVTADGIERHVDAIIYGTGFQVTDMPHADNVYGRAGKRLADEWNGSPKVYLGTSVSGFPNLFFLLGPNTGLGHNSVVLMIEAQIAYILSALRYMRRTASATVEPKLEVQRAYDSELQRRTRGTVWVEGGCQSWYLDKTGRNSTLWPSSVPAFKRRIGTFKSKEYLVTR